MKTPSKFGRFLLFAVFIFISCSFARAQTAGETVDLLAPILNRQGTMIVHVDLRKIEPDNWTERLTMFFDAQLPEFGFDSKSRRGIMAEWKKLVAKKLPEIKGHLEDFFNETGICDLYFISYFQDDDLAPPFFAIPLQGVTESQKNSIKAKLESISPYEDPLPLVEARGFLMLPVSDFELLSEDEADDLLEFFDDFTPQPLPELVEALKCHESAFVTLAILLPENLSDFPIDFDDDFPAKEPLTRFWNVFGTHAKWFSQGCYIDELQSIAVMKMTDDKAVEELDQALKALLTWCSEEIERNAAKNEFLKPAARLIRISFEEVARQVGPVKENDRLVVMIDPSNFALYYSFMAHFVFINEDLFNE